MLMIGTGYTGSISCLKKKKHTHSSKTNTFACFPQNLKQERQNIVKTTLNR